MQRRNRAKTTKAKNHFFVFFIFFLNNIHPLYMSPSASTGPCRKQLYGNRLWHCYLLHFIIQTVNWDYRKCTALSTSSGHLSSILTKKRRGKSALSIVVTPVINLWKIAQLIAGMNGCTSRWHNTPQSSICAWKDIMSASPVVSTRIYNIYSGSANIILPVIHPLLKYGLQNQFTYCSCLWLSCQAF